MATYNSAVIGDGSHCREISFPNSSGIQLHASMGSRFGTICKTSTVCPSAVGRASESTVKRRRTKNEKESKTNNKSIQSRQSVTSRLERRTSDRRYVSHRGATIPVEDCEDQRGAGRHGDLPYSPDFRRFGRLSLTLHQTVGEPQGGKESGKKRYW